MLQPASTRAATKGAKRKAAPAPQATPDAPKDGKLTLERIYEGGALSGATPAMLMFSPDGKKLVFASILRAGTGILDGMLDVVPGARVGHIGLYRDPQTLQAVEYYFKMPQDMQERDVIVVDPMLATGNSAIAAIDRIRELKPRSIKFVCLLTCPEGIAALSAAHPDVPIYTAAVDRQLNDHGYILPGLGDAGDRIFGTK